MNHTITCKHYGQIYVKHEADIDDVKDIIKAMDDLWFSIPALVGYCQSKGIVCWIYHNKRQPKPPVRVELAAIKSMVDGLVFSVPRPGRHHDVIKLMAMKGYPIPIRGHQGFLLNTGDFVGRHVGLEIATEADQLLDRCDRDYNQLFSEDVWEGRLNWDPYLNS